MAVILIVEADKNQRLLLEEELAYEGYATCSVANGDEALSALPSARPDLVVLDVRGPVSQALGLVGKLCGEGHHLPVVIHTAYPNGPDVFLQRLADGFLMKQSNLSPLISTIRRILQRGAAPARQPLCCGPTGPCESTAARTGVA